MILIGVMSHGQLYLFLFYIFLSIGLNDASRFRIQNRCNDTIWVGFQTAPGHRQMKNGGFRLRTGDTIGIDPPRKWAGRVWGRQGCFFDDHGIGSCLIGDCGGLLDCGNKEGLPPASVAQFTIDSPIDYFNVSLIDGYNLPLSIIPIKGIGNNCKAARCLADVNSKCPRDMQVVNGGRVIACNSACQAFNQPEYCCTGNFRNSETCKPSEYSRVFKSACPQAYTYAFDDKSNTFTCSKADYFIRFC